MRLSSHGESSALLTISAVLFHSSLRELHALIDSVISGIKSAGLSSVEFVLVDHSGCDEYAERCRSLLSTYNNNSAIRLELLQMPENRGYGAGHNAAASRVRATFHLVLNPDVVLSKRTIGLLLNALQANDDIALLAPVGLDSAGAPAFLAKAYPSVWVLGLRGFAPEWLKQKCAHTLGKYELRNTINEQSIRSVTLASGCCMLLRRSVFDEIGGFDESFFLYFEDYDLSLRMAQYGAVKEHSGAHIIHHGGKAAGKGWNHMRWFITSAVRFFNRWGWRWLGP